MDIASLLVSSAISIGSYIIYKLLQRYYCKSNCHDSKIELEFLDKEEEKKVDSK